MKSRTECEPSCLFVILHQQWRGGRGMREHTIPSFTGETTRKRAYCYVNINIEQDVHKDYIQCKEKKKNKQLLYITRTEK